MDILLFNWLLADDCAASALFGETWSSYPAEQNRTTKLHNKIDNRP
jgi:hypothetical protein